MAATIRLRFLFGFLALAVAACGGGGGGDGGGGVESASPPTVFTLDDPVYAEPGGSRTFNLTGFSNDGDSLTATFSLTRQSDTPINGQMAEQINMLVSVSVVGGGTTEASITTFSTPEGVFLGSINNITQVQGFPLGQQTPPPGTAKIGDSGFLGAIGYSDGASASVNWRLDPHQGTADRAELVESLSAQNPDREVVLTRIIDTSGNTVAVKLTYLFPDGFTVDLST